MSTGTKDKIIGTIKKSIGGAKENIGAAINNKDLEGEGSVQKYGGVGQQLMGVIKDKIQKGSYILGVILEQVGKHLQGKKPDKKD